MSAPRVDRAYVLSVIEAMNAFDSMDLNRRAIEVIRDLMGGPRCPDCDALLSDTTTDTDGNPTYCDECDRECELDPAGACADCERSNGPGRRCPEGCDCDCHTTTSTEEN
jgi:hypothetical protein